MHAYKYHYSVNDGRRDVHTTVRCMHFIDSFINRENRFFYEQLQKRSLQVKYCIEEKKIQQNTNNNNYYNLLICILWVKKIRLSCCFFFLVSQPVHRALHSHLLSCIKVVSVVSISCIYCKTAKSCCKRGWRAQRTLSMTHIRWQLLRIVCVCA